MKHILWLAYGRHLGRPQMEQDAPQHRVVGLAFVHDYQLTFRAQPANPGPSLASAEAAQGKRMAGLLYLIPEAEWQQLLDLHQETYLPHPITVLPLGSRSTATAAQWFLPRDYQDIPPTGRTVFQVFHAARILPGYPNGVLNQLEKMAMDLRPQ